MFFFIGRRYGTRLLEKFPKLKPKCDKAFDWIEHYAVAYILSYRFMYGIRNVSGVALGMSHVPWKKFAFYNVFAAALWALVFCGAGYVFGDMIAHLGRNKEETVNFSVREFMIGALILFGVVMAIKSGLNVLHRKKEEKKAARATQKDSASPLS